MDPPPATTPPRRGGGAIKALIIGIIVVILVVIIGRLVLAGMILSWFKGATKGAATGAGTLAAQQALGLSKCCWIDKNNYGTPNQLGSKLTCDITPGTPASAYTLVDRPCPVPQIGQQ